MLESLTKRIGQAIQKIKGHDKITASNIGPTLKEIRRALVEADVPYKVAKEFIQEVKEEALGTEVQVTISPGQLFTKLVQDQLTKIMGGEAAPRSLMGNPTIIMIVGLQGAGKTTLAAKLAAHFKNQNRDVLLVACDVYRPAAVQQLQILAKQADIDVYANPQEKDPTQIVREALEQAKASHKKIVIIDTAGRQSVDEAMMNEIIMLKEQCQPHETLFVADAMMGQISIDTITAFHNQIDFDGVALTKMDSDTRGGAAIAIRKVTNQPIKWISTGEKLADLEVFHPDRVARRILGMADVVSLVERAEKVFSEEEARKISKKLHRQQFDFNDLKKQIDQLKNMGTIQSIMKLIPGMNHAEIDDRQFDSWRVVIDSMTPYERENPDVLRNYKRQVRIAGGSGTSLTILKKMLKKFEEMRKKAKHIRKGGFYD